MRARLNDAITLLRTGDPERIGEAIALLQGTVFAFSMKVCGHREDAEDTMQEVLLRSLPHLSKIEHPRALAVWLYTVTRNRCWRSRRRPAHAPKETLSLDELMPDHDELQRLLRDKSHGPEEHVAGGEEQQLLHRAVQMLPAQYRIVLVLHDMEELDTDLVAQILDLQPGTVRVRLHRARLGLRKLMAQLLEGRSPSLIGSRSPRSRNNRANTNGSGPQCRAIFANLSEFLDQRLASSSCEKMQEHIKACPACVAFITDLSTAIDRCRQFEVPQNPHIQSRLRSLLVEEYVRFAGDPPPKTST